MAMFLVKITAGAKAAPQLGKVLPIKAMWSKQKGFFRSLHCDRAPDEILIGVNGLFPKVQEGEQWKNILCSLKAMLLMLHKECCSSCVNSILLFLRWGKKISPHPSYLHRLFSYIAAKGLGTESLTDSWIIKLGWGCASLSTEGRKLFFISHYW